MILAYHELITITILDQTPWSYYTKPDNELIPMILLDLEPDHVTFFMIKGNSYIRAWNN